MIQTTVKISKKHHFLLLNHSLDTRKTIQKIMESMIEDNCGELPENWKNLYSSLKKKQSGMARALTLESYRKKKKYIDTEQC